MAEEEVGVFGGGRLTERVRSLEADSAAAARFTFPLFDMCA